MDRYRAFKGDLTPHFCTCSIHNWLPLFNGGTAYFEIITDSLRFCRTRKQLLLHAYVIMTDHLHLILSHSDVSSLMRDFKSWTADRLLERMRTENRTDWLKALHIGYGPSGQPLHQVWQNGFHPKSIDDDAILSQKLDYIHNNPVTKGFVVEPAAWRYSSARNYEFADHSVLEIDPIDPLHL